MKLAIADPPYLGRAAMFYGTGNTSLNTSATSSINPAYKADCHPEAEMWDDPETHAQLIRKLCSEYEAWAVAMAADSLRHYLSVAPDDAIVAIWHDPGLMPTGRHPRRKWEAVLLRRGEGRRRTNDVPCPTGDLLTCPHGQALPGRIGTGTSFAGAKPPQWTRWVLDMLGFNPATDTVDDLFPGSGSVASAIAQGVLL